MGNNNRFPTVGQPRKPSEVRAAKSRPGCLKRCRGEIGNAGPKRRRKRYWTVRVERKIGHVDGEPPVEKVVVREIAVASQAIRTGRVAGASMRLIDEPVVKLPVRVLDDHLKKLLADRGLTKMGRISGAVLERIAQEYLADDRSEGRIFLAPDAGLQFIVLNVEVHRSGPSQHERERIQR